MPLPPPTPERLAFAKRLRTLRAARGYRFAKAFSDALGIEHGRYTRYERGEVEPNLTTIVAMCRLLDVMPNELLGYQDRPERHF
jgi:transcriptional regulator with XRE-family HTH domain